MNPFDYRRHMRKVLGFFAAGLVVLAIGMALVTLVLQPIIWVTNMLGRIHEMLDFNPEGSEEITDYREDLDELTKENHIAYRYSDMLACSMNEKYTHDIKGCAAFLQEDGTFEKSVDLGPAESFRLYSKEIDEYQGMIPDSAYEDIWIPTLYEMDHYREEPVIDEETGEPKRMKTVRKKRNGYLIIPKRNHTKTHALHMNRRQNAGKQERDSTPFLTFRQPVVTSRTGMDMI
ncbi:MAG: hypothetical protein IKG37_01550 [Solobacterium sp.]|nr:hypothetical protein [Solobacterium sp.]